MKWRFLDEDAHGIAVSMYPQLEMNPPGNSARRGLVERGAEFVLPVEIAHTFGKTLLYGEVGHVWREHERDGWIYGLAVQYPNEGPIELTGEIHGECEGDLTDSELLFNIGARAKLTDHVALLLSAGRTIRQPQAEHFATFSYLGLQFNF